ncbi:MAG: hypothetical protein IH892_04510 [Planctomycetes bacterium]|nr:hypothetical protein [Planctomycetota bacterium]
MIEIERPGFPWPLLKFWFWRTCPMWCAFALVIFLMQIAICGIIHDNERVKVMLKMIDMMPSILKTALGGDSLQVGNVSGLIAIGYNHPLVLLSYMFFAVSVPTGRLTGEAQSGTMELILSRFVTKTQVYLCAALITLVGMYALVLVMFLGTVTATWLYDFGQPIPLYRFFQTAINAGLLASTIGAVALLSAAMFRHRHMAVGVAVSFIVINYFVSLIANWWPRMGWMKPVTLFTYVNGHKIFVEKVWPWSDMAVLVGVLLFAAMLGGIVWQRRDLSA